MTIEPENAADKLKMSAVKNFRVDFILFPWGFMFFVSGFHFY
jgi:hypothetical protein